MSSFLVSSDVAVKKKCGKLRKWMLSIEQKSICCIKTFINELFDFQDIKIIQEIKYFMRVINSKYQSYVVRYFKIHDSMICSTLWEFAEIGAKPNPC